MPDPVGQGLQGDGDPDLGLPTVTARCGRVVQVAAADLDDRVIASLAWTALVLNTRALAGIGYAVLTAALDSPPDP
ncbi:MAG: hypothetical protein M3492_00195 [Actinomycetota bacterium]|nr:hypothetical protein [Actinomycetota bacterium]